MLPSQHSILNASNTEPPSFAATLPSLSSAPPPPPPALGAEGSQRKASPIRRKGSSSSKSRSSPRTTSHDNDDGRSLLIPAPADKEGGPPQQQQQALPSAPPLASSLYGPFTSVLQSSVGLRSVDAEPSLSSTAPTVHPSALHIRLERAAALVDDPLTSYLQAPTESSPLRSSNMPTTPTLLSVQGTSAKIPAMDLPLSTAFNASLHMTSTTNSNHSCSKPFSACGPLATLSSDSSGGGGGGGGVGALLAAPAHLTAVADAGARSVVLPTAPQQGHPNNNNNGGGGGALLADFFVSTNLRDVPFVMSASSQGGAWQSPCGSPRLITSRGYEDAPSFEPRLGGGGGGEDSSSRLSLRRSLVSSEVSARHRASSSSSGVGSVTSATPPLPVRPRPHNLVEVNDLASGLASLSTEAYATPTLPSHHHAQRTMKEATQAEPTEKKKKRKVVVTVTTVKKVRRVKKNKNGDVIVVDPDVGGVGTSNAVVEPGGSVSLSRSTINSASVGSSTTVITRTKRIVGKKIVAKAAPAGQAPPLRVEPCARPETTTTTATTASEFDNAQAAQLRDVHPSP